MCLAMYTRACCGHGTAVHSKLSRVSLLLLLLLFWYQLLQHIYHYRTDKCPFWSVQMGTGVVDNGLMKYH